MPALYADNPCDFDGLLQWYRYLTSCCCNHMLHTVKVVLTLREECLSRGVAGIQHRFSINNQRKVCIIIYMYLAILSNYMILYNRSEVRHMDCLVNLKCHVALLAAVVIGGFHTQSVYFWSYKSVTMTSHHPVMYVSSRGDFTCHIK